MKSVGKVFLFAFILLGSLLTVNVTKASAYIQRAVPQYQNEWVEVQVSGGTPMVYYQQVKENQTLNLNSTKWVAAVEKDGFFYIDFSGTSNTKSIYYALTTDPESTEAEEVVEIPVVVKSVKIDVDYSVEKHTGGGIYKIIRGVDIKFVDKARDIKTTNPSVIDDYYFEWRRSVNAAWSARGDFKQFDWDLLRGSQGTLYVRAIGDTTDALYRPSKEVKLKLPKVANAPSVKVDYVKGTFGIKNGMQVRTYETNGVAANWLTVAQFDKTAQTGGIFGASYDSVTKDKISSIALWELVDELSTTISTDIELEDSVTIDVRTAATDKKFPSAVRSIRFTMPLDKPYAWASLAIDCTLGDKELRIPADFCINFSEILRDTSPVYSDYEYFLANKDDNVDLRQQKWTKVPANGIANLSSKIGKSYSYIKSDGSERSLAYENTSVIYVRRAPDTAAKWFASEAAKVELRITKQ